MFRDYGDSSNYLSDKVRSISIHDSLNNLYEKVISKNKKTNRSININFNNNIINDSNLYLKYYNEIRDIIFGKNVKEDDNISFIHQEMIKRVKELIKLESTHKIKFTSENQLSFFVEKKDEIKIENEKKFDDKNLHICGRVEIYNYCDKYNKKRKNNGINEITRVAHFEFKKRYPSNYNKIQIKNETKNLEKRQENSKTLNRRNNNNFITYNNNNNFNYCHKANYIYSQKYINNNNNINNATINNIHRYKSRENFFDKNKKINK